MVGGTHASGTHAVPRVTSVNPGACKYNHQDEPWEGIFSPFEPEPLSVELVRPLLDYPGSFLKTVKPMFVGRNRVHPVQSCESVSILGKPRSAFPEQEPCVELEWKNPLLLGEKLS